MSEAVIWGKMEQETKIDELEVLPICMDCKDIRINAKDEISERWLKRDLAPTLYDMHTQKYKGQFSHTYCPICAEKFKSENQEYFK